MRNVSLLNILTVVFVVAKLWGKIGWSWWLVTLPTWGGIILVLIIAGLMVLTKVDNILKKK